MRMLSASRRYWLVKDLPHVEVELPHDANPTQLLEEAMSFIERHPDRHDQAMWMASADDHDLPGVDETPGEVPLCGTAGCLAGWGITLNNANEGSRIYGFESLVVVDDDRYVVPIDRYAAKLFGITRDQADVLFEGDWSRRQLRAGVDALKDEPGTSGRNLRSLMEAA